MIFRRVHPWKAVAASAAIVLLAQEAGLAGCGGGAKAAAAASAAPPPPPPAVASFTTVGNIVNAAPLAPADFSAFFSANPPKQNGVTLSQSVITQDLASGGSWVVSINGKPVETIKCTRPDNNSLINPVAKSSAQPVTNLKVDSARGSGTHTWGCSKGGAAAGAGAAAAAAAPAAVASAAAVVNLISLDANAIIATDFKTTPSKGPASINGHPVDNFTTVVTTQLVGGKAEIKVLTTAFAKDITDPGTLPCAIANPGTDPAVVTLLGEAIQVRSAKASTVTPKISIEGNFPTGKFLMYAQLQTFDINRIPPALGGTDLPSDVFSMEVGKIVIK